jgi:LPS transport system D
VHNQNNNRQSASCVQINQRRKRRKLRYCLQVAAWAAATTIWAATADLWATNVDPIITPTVFPVLQPSSAINEPLTVMADHTAVWVSPSGTQQMLLNGNARIKIGYRILQADNAALWLKPSTASGFNQYHVNIFLTGHVMIYEGPGPTLNTAQDLLVTTDVMGNVQIAGGEPIPLDLSSSPVVQRGENLMQVVANRPRGMPFIPTIQVQDTELALSNGWLARGAGNQIIPTPTILQQHPPTTGRNAGPPALILASANIIDRQLENNQGIIVARGQFFLVRETANGNPPLELHANNAVLFSPPGQGANTGPNGRVHSISQKVQGVYLEGDVTVTYGDQTIRAEKVYYDFTTDRAIMLDAVLSTYDLKTQSPLYLRAAEIMQLAQGEFAAKSVKLSTDEFYTPHYYIGADSMTIRSIAAPATPGNAAPQNNNYAFTATGTTLNAFGAPLFYWPYLAGTTEQQPTPLKSINVGYSDIFGATIRTDWDPLQLAGIQEPKNVTTDWNLDELSKRGPATGLDTRYNLGTSQGFLNSYIMYDDGTDNLGVNRDNIPLDSHLRGFVSGREQQQLNDQWTIALSASYISDPNFLEQYFQNEYATAPEQETSVYIKQQNQNEAFSVLGTWNLNRFVANADLEEDEFATQKYPEIQYLRNGDKLFGLLTYYGNSTGGVLDDKFSDATPAERALQLQFPGPGITPNESFSQYYLQNGWTDQSIARFDSRQELDLPLAAGPLEFTPFVTGRITYWDTDFPVQNNSPSGGTTRAWGSVGVRSTATFWRTYENVDSNFFDVHGLRHIIQPEVDVFASGSNVQEGYLQPYDRDVEGITDASGAQIALHQIFQTKRGRPGQEETVDWITFDVDADMFWNNHENPNAPFNPANPMYAGAPFATSDFGQPLIGYYDFTEPELSQVADSINADLVWKAGSNVSFLADESYNMDEEKVVQIDSGVAVDQSPSLSYFLGNRYIGPLDSDQWTGSVNYALSEQYALSMTQSYDFSLKHNILSELTIVRHLPRLYAAITLGYDADSGNTALFVSIWPAGYPSYGITSPGALAAVQQ